MVSRTFPTKGSFKEAKLPKKKKEERILISCERVHGGFIFGDMAQKPPSYRVITSPVDAITIFNCLIHGEKLLEITAHQEEKAREKA